MIFISRAKESIWGPPYFLVKNVSIQQGSFGVSSEQERKRVFWIPKKKRGRCSIPSPRE
jgi:hypothetical protein